VHASVGGKIAQLGQRLIDGVAKSMAEDFFKRFDAEMQRQHPQAYAMPPLRGRWRSRTRASDAGRRWPVPPGSGSDWARPWCWPSAGHAQLLKRGQGEPAMENLDVMVLRTLRDWRVAGKRALLATVVRTWGSSPRPVGSIMALCEDGSVVGSVSGGCIEDDLIYRFTQAYAQAPRQECPGRAPMPSGRAGLRQVRHHRRRGAPLRPALRRHAGAAAGVRPGRRSLAELVRRWRRPADAAHGAPGRRR
jgi:hypothetical protein